MNKRGLMLSQVVEIIVAVIIIGLIIFGISRAFATYFGNQKENQAKATLDGITTILDSMEVGQIEKYNLKVPAGWSLVAFDVQHNENQGFKKAQTYFGQNALCACEKKDCKICQTTKMPVKKADILLNMKISILDIWFTNLQDYYNLTESEPTIQPQLTEQENQEIKQEIITTNQMITTNNYDSLITSAAEKYYPEVSNYVTSKEEFKNILKAMITIESKGLWNAIGTSGEIGLIQIMPQNAIDLGLKIYDPGNKITNIPAKDMWGDALLNYLKTDYVSALKTLKKTKTQAQLIALDDRFDATKNLDAGARLLANYIKQMHNRDLGIMAYNGGVGGVNKYCKPLVVTACNTDWMAYKYLEKIKTAMA